MGDDFDFSHLIIFSNFLLNMNKSEIRFCGKHGYTEHYYYGKDNQLKCRKCDVDYGRIKRHRIKKKLVEYKRW